MYVTDECFRNYLTCWQPTHETKDKVYWQNAWSLSVTSVMISNPANSDTPLSMYYITKYVGQSVQKSCDPRADFSHFYTVFRKNWPNYRLAAEKSCIHIEYI